MQIRLEHRIDASVEEVERATLDDTFQLRLTSLPNVHERRILSQDERQDGTVHRVVRYRFGGNIPAPVLRAIGGATVSWDEEGTFDPAAHEWRFVIHPHVMKGRLECDGRYSFSPQGNETLRVVQADVTVKVPLVGRRVERFIADGLTDTMNAEARILEAFIREQKETAS